MKLHRRAWLGLAVVFVVPASLPVAMFLYFMVDPVAMYVTTVAGSLVGPWAFEHYQRVPGESQ